MYAMRDEIDFENLQGWLVDRLQDKGIYRYSQIIDYSEEEILDLGILTSGELRNILVHMEKIGLSFKSGENSLNRLHLHNPGLFLLRENGVMDLFDLQALSVYDLAYKIGVGMDKACDIASRMAPMGYFLSA